MILPCKECDKRSENCHASCEDYKAWKAIHDAEHKKIADRRRFVGEQKAMTSANIKRMLHGKHKK